MHANSYRLFEKYALPYFLPGAKVLEIGPDEKPGDFSLHDLVTLRGVSYFFADAYRDRSAVPGHIGMSGGYQIFAGDGVFDVVFAANVTEHVRKVWEWIPELRRVTKPGGHVILVSPVSWPYHEAPIDCWRLYPEAYRGLFDDAGLQVILAVCESLETIDPEWIEEHGSGKVIDTIAIGRKPVFADK